MAPTQLNKVLNFAKSRILSSFHGAKSTSRINKLNHSIEQAIELTDLLKENKMLKDQLDT